MKFGQLFRKINLMSLDHYIHSAYCTCTTEILGTCNHVTGILFRIENVVQTGLNAPSKTNVLCTWNLPKGQRVDTTVKPVRDLGFV